MKYNIIINQKAVIDNGWTKLTFDHIAILDVIVACINSRSFASLQDDTGTWFWVKVSKIVDELPMLRVKERRCKELINDLVEYQLLEINSNNQNYQRHYLRMGINYSKMQFDTYAENSSTMQDPAKHYAGSCVVPMQNPAYDNNTNYNIHKDDDDKEKTDIYKTPSSSWADIKKENGIDMPLKEIVQEMVNDQGYVEYLAIDIGRIGLKTNVELTKHYINQAYIHIKTVSGIKRKDRSDGRSHIRNLILKDARGNKELYNKAKAEFINKQTTKQ